MKEFQIEDHPHRRYNPLEREWILVSPHRLKRPWRGKKERKEEAERPRYQSDCYLCPGNTRAGGKRNPDYTRTFVFDNDYMAILPDVPPGSVDVRGRGLLLARGEEGLCRVVCFSPRHDLTLPEMDESTVREVVEVWKEQYLELGAREKINYVTIFENKGELMGCSNPHPHCQIWANTSIPTRPEREMAACADYRRENGRCLVCDIRQLEEEVQERIVCANESFTAFVPFWAVWPYEIMVVSHRHLGSLDAMTREERRDYAGILHSVTIRYDNLFSTSFPYSMGMHQSPTDGVDHPECHFHAHFFPPLLRSAVNRKFVVGYELTSEPQRDITPEVAAQSLAKLPETHYRMQRQK